MTMCIHGQEYESCTFGCTFRKAEDLRLENDKLKAEVEKILYFIKRGDVQDLRLKLKHIEKRLEQVLKQDEKE